MTFLWFCRMTHLSQPTHLTRSWHCTKTSTGSRNTLLPCFHKPIQMATVVHALHPPGNPTLTTPAATLDPCSPTAHSARNAALAFAGSISVSALPQSTAHVPVPGWKMRTGTTNGDEWFSLHFQVASFTSTPLTESSFLSILAPRSVSYPQILLTAQLTLIRHLQAVNATSIPVHLRKALLVSLGLC